MLFHRIQSEAGIGTKWGSGLILCRIEIEVEIKKSEGKQKKKGGVGDHRSPESLGKQGNGVESLLDVCCTERQGLGLGRWESLRLGRLVTGDDVVYLGSCDSRNVRLQGTRNEGYGGDFSI